MSGRSSWTWTTEAHLPSIRGAGQPFLDELLQELAKVEWPQREVFGIRLAVEEALVNAIRHGNSLDHEKHVEVSCRLNDRHLQIEIADQGAGFDHRQVPDCTEEENLHRPSGRGIMLMRTYMTRVEYLDGGHRVVMEKQRGAAD
jgi:serine/threonine-protein kinase RsbW